MAVSIEAPSGSLDTSAQAEWSLPRRVGFRFLFLYVVFFCFPFPLYNEPVTRFIGSVILDPVIARLQWVVPAFAQWAFGIDASAAAVTGSGDRAIDWAGTAFIVLLSAALTAVWSVAARRASHHRMLAGALRIFVRYFLAYTLLAYGFAKVFPSQFIPPGAERMVAPLGELSPMGLMWTFMGFSPAYTIFAGACELLGGALLFFRRTSTLGALVVIAVMSNVAMMNFCYDVPVKLNSLHYLAFAGLLAAPDARRLFDFFVANRPVASIAIEPRTKATRIAKGLLIAMMTWGTMTTGLDTWESKSAPIPLAGAYSVQGKADIARIGIGPRGLRVLHTDGTSSAFWVKLDDPSKIVVLSGDPAGGETLAVTPDADGAGMTLAGTLAGEPVTLRLRRLDPPLLASRGFHWIQERPFNR